MGVGCPEYILLGLPPRRQGKANWHCVRRPALRITPAQAGKSSCHVPGACPRRDHPRVGGEKQTYCFRSFSPGGSPPRRRGKEVADEGIGGIIRITPAWAGKRSTGPPLTQTTVDHPRVGGEKELPDYRTVKAWGSPPHGRGKANRHSVPSGFTGITPAWAGKRSGPCCKCSG